MAEIARITRALMLSLQVPLQSTQLVLVHNQPIAISFNRKTYTAGKNSHRLFKPKEAQEYQEYILFLQSRGLLLPGIEYLELEVLQGISGLKALPVEIFFGE